MTEKKLADLNMLAEEIDLLENIGRGVNEINETLTKTFPENIIHSAIFPLDLAVQQSIKLLKEYFETL